MPVSTRLLHGLTLLLLLIEVAAASDPLFILLLLVIATPVTVSGMILTQGYMLSEDAKFSLKYFVDKVLRYRPTTIKFNGY